MSESVMANVHKNLLRRAGLTWRNKVHQALRNAREAKLTVGCSVLFGLEGETRASIEETIAGVAELIELGLVSVASPNILTYHPATEITRRHGMTDKLDYHSPQVHSRAPYSSFEEAYPGVVSKRLTEADIWFIHRETMRAWGTHRHAPESNGSPAPNGQAP